jgi:class 3 adenylate cyclase
VPKSGALIAVLFVDIVGSTRLYREVGNERAEALVAAALDRAADSAARHQGKRVKSIGDAAMCSFPDAAHAARAATEMQQQARHPPVEADPVLLELRIGFAFGEAVERDGDYFGDVVNIAARLSDLAKAGQILTTEEAAGALPDKLRKSARLFDHTPVKGVSEPVTVSQLVWDSRGQTEVLSADHVVGALKLDLQYGDKNVVLTPLKLPFVLGRQPDCGLVVEAPFASRHHLRIEYRRGKFVLVDESTNGTYVAHQGESDETLSYVRNEPFALVGSGRFWLGARPEEGGEAVRYVTE